jgi:hypothetical protein
VSREAAIAILSRLNVRTLGVFRIEAAKHDNEKWSVPGRCGYRIVFATWDTVTRRPEELLRDLGAALAA